MIGDADERAVIIAAGSRYEDWKTVEVVWEWAAPMIQFNFSASEYSDLPLSFAAMKLRPDDDCDIELAGHQVIRQGKIQVRQVAYTAEQHGVQFIGGSRLTDVIKSSAPIDRGEFRNYTFESIANSVLRDFKGIRLKMDGQPKEASEKFKVVAINYGETVWNFLNRLAHMRNIRLSDDGKGNILASGPDSSHGSGGDLEEGRNILRANMIMRNDAVNSPLRVDGQQGADNETYGKDAAQPSAKVTNPLIAGFAPLIMLAENPGTYKEMKIRADRQVQHQYWTYLQVDIDVQGWLNDQGELWKPGPKDITVRSPMLFPDQPPPLYIDKVVFRQDPNGTITTLTLVDKQALGSKTRGLLPGEDQAGGLGKDVPEAEENRGEDPVKPEGGGSR